MNTDVLIAWITLMIENLPALAAIVGAGATILAYFKQSDRKEFLTAINETAMIVVRSIQQDPEWRGVNPAAKKARAATLVSDILTQRGIKVDKATLEVAIEGAVWLMKNAPVAIEGIQETVNAKMPDRGYTNHPQAPRREIY